VIVSGLTTEPQATAQPSVITAQTQSTGEATSPLLLPPCHHPSIPVTWHLPFCV